MITWTIKIIVESWKLTYCKGVKGVKAKGDKSSKIIVDNLGLLFKVGQRKNQET